MLRPRGVLRISTPCLETLSREYIARSEKARLLLARNREKGYDFGPSLAATLNKGFYADGHRYLYDYETLAQMLVGAGFALLTRCQVGRSEDTELRGIERHDVGTIADDFALVVEATKPG